MPTSFSLESWSTRKELKFVIVFCLIAQRFDTLAADERYTARTLQTSCSPLPVLGCTDIPRTSTGYVPKARYNGSAKWSDAVCWGETSRNPLFQILLGLQRCQTSERQTWDLSKTGDRSILSYGKIVSSGRPDAISSRFGARGHGNRSAEHFEVNLSCRTSHFVSQTGSR